MSELKKTVHCECVIVVDEDGNYAVGHDLDSAAEAFEENVGGNGPRRIVRVLVAVPVPTVAILKGVAPAEGEAALTSVS